jgi:hypothetical protein
LDDGQGLEINDAGMEDIGTWTCKAENSAGVTEKVIKLNVFGKFSIDQSLLIIKL